MAFLPKKAADNRFLSPWLRFRVTPSHSSSLPPARASLSAQPHALLLLQLLGFAKVKSMFAKAFQLLG